jgi:hypothetical protein
MNEVYITKSLDNSVEFEQDILDLMMKYGYISDDEKHKVRGIRCHVTEPLKIELYEELDNE